MSHRVEDVELLRPLYELGARYHETRARLVRVGQAAVDAVGACADAVDTKAWRAAARGVLDSADALDGLAAEVLALGFRELAVALGEAASAAAEVARGAHEQVWTAAVRVAADARWDDEEHVFFAGLTMPWSRVAWAGWTYAGARHGLSWSAVWHGRIFLPEWPTLLDLPDRTLAEAAAVGADASRKARDRFVRSLIEPDK